MLCISFKLGEKLFSFFKFNFFYVIYDDEEVYFYDFFLKFIKYMFYIKRKSLV